MEERECIVIDNKTYTVITKVIDDCEKNDKLYEVFSSYALDRLKKIS